MDAHMKTPSVEAMELLSESWCSSAIQVFQPAIRESSIIPSETSETCPIPKSDRNLKMEDVGQSKSSPPWKIDDLKSWIWVQQAMHPELDYDLCFRKKWFSRKFKSWTGVSIKKWMKEMKRKRKEEDRLRRAEVHAAISVAGVAAALAAIAAENNTTAGDRQPKSLKETAIASAAALVAVQCAQVAEAAGAKRDQIASAIDAATTATDASNIITLTAAAATSLKGAATLRGRPGHRESLPAVENDSIDFDYGRCRALLAKGDELLVETSDGKCRLRAVSIVLNVDGQVILKIKKHNFFMVFSSSEESIVYRLAAKLHKEPLEKNDESYSIKMTTSRGEIELIIDDYMQYRRWSMTIDQMLLLSTTLGKYGNSTVQ